jgi:glycyl-tRNA synthetase
MKISENTKMDKLISLCKRRGFIFPSGEKYGGLQGFWDFGPLGVELKNNIKKAWWKKFVQERQDIVGLDSTIITNPTVWEKSGHVTNFKDVLMECKSCHLRFKADDMLPVEIQKQMNEKALEFAKLLEDGSIISSEANRRMDEFIGSVMPEINKSVQCSNCGKSDWTPPRGINTMFKTQVGPVEKNSTVAYLRPETAQNIFINFDNVRQAMRLRVPFGIAQIGKAFRNEITPGNFIFRSREFEQMEIEYFINPKDDDKIFKKWVDDSYQWFIDLGIKKSNLNKREQFKEELAHYAKQTVDIEYAFPFDKGYAELMGIANRQDFDLKAHGFSYKDDLTKEEFVPYVIEPSAGVDRAALAFLLDAYDEVKGGRTTTTESNKEEEVVLRLHKDLAPFKVAILPLSKKEQLSSVALEIHHKLQPHFMTAYDDVSSIGRRYRRQDEIGTPYCVTVDFDSLEDKKVTVRDRDTMKQERIAVGELKDYLKEQF